MKALPPYLIAFGALMALTACNERSPPAPTPPPVESAAAPGDATAPAPSSDSAAPPPGESAAPSIQTPPTQPEAKPPTEPMNPAALSTPPA
ncbi:hypothetical protein [Brevundimonas sp.]|uniref:hypothetical protein n=1 Tax=Brevundimonas sp. TaxID=1871086 RepID=UPI002EDB06A0